MKWPWQRDREGHARADEAMRLSRQQREDAHREAEHARRRAALWRRWQRENHFADAFRHALEGKEQ